MRIICFPGVALLLALGSVPLARAQSPATAPAAQPAVPSVASSALAPQDRHFIGEMAQAVRAQIEASLLAMLKGEDQTVRGFAREMVATHEHWLSRIMRLAEERGVELPKQPSSLHEARVKTLRDMQPNGFEREYARAYGVQNLQWMRSLAERQIEHGNAPEVQTFARQVLPQLEAQIRQGQALSALQAFPDTAGLR